jgi:hypothetical protein
MTSPIADGVLAATHRLVQQAMSGQWQDVPKTVEERRVLLDRLSASASAQDQQWLSALKQAMAESDAVVASLTPDRSPSAAPSRSSSAAGAGALEQPGAGVQQRPPARQTAFVPAAQPADAPAHKTAEVDVVMDMILGRRV